MAKQAPVPRPQEELLGQSTPYHLKRILIIYMVLALAILASTLFFILNHAMDTLQTLLTIITLLCVAAGAHKAVQTAKTQVLLYDTCFQVGDSIYRYAEIYQLEHRKEQVSFRTGKGVMDRHSFFAGNADALYYIINKKSKEARRAAKKQKNTPR